MPGNVSIKPFLLYFSVVALLIVLAYRSIDRSLDKIEKRGYMTLITTNGPTTYYLYREEEMGFEYDLAKAFADYQGVELKVLVAEWDEMILLLRQGKGDFVGAGLGITDERNKVIDFSRPHFTIKHSVIIHKNDREITDLKDLDGEVIHIRRRSSCEESLKELVKQGYDIEIKPHDSVPTEELISLIASKKIRVTVADSNIALLSRRYYPDIRIPFTLDKKKYLGWAVRKGSKKLLGAINRFLDEIEKNGVYAKIYEKYYSDIEIFDYVDIKKFHRRIQTRLPRFQAIIEKAAEEHDFDWRLIAAIVYQESHFRPRARSYTGVKGLMQLTLKTARDMGIKNRLDPKQSMHGGVKYLKRIYSRYDDIKGWDRMLMTLASYNVGPGHISDARQLAREKGLDPNKWSSLTEVLPLLSYKKYYKKTKCGYCRGSEPVEYVKRIVLYYDILKMQAVNQESEGV
ncbi:MAG: membrane-bound lytic murein transglycosylase MltF [Deltaproteobacteria bacterium]|nr:membrane-bound lytic murein transglycosylase MltF [Deltaproteobacteria bacterium]MBW2338755.1 membrane-bound lytic murein transglycosylase MltF [Deltaproteobacteria bacterium]